MSRPYRLDVRLAIIVTAMSAVTLFAAGMVLKMEFTGGQFAIEERGLSSQVEDWAALVRREADGSVVFERPAETTDDLDPPYTGLLTGARPVYGYAVVDADGRVLDRSLAKAPAGRPGPRTTRPVLSSGPALDGSGHLLIGEVFVPEAGVWLRVARARSDVEALANTFFAQLLEEMGWVALILLLAIVVTGVAVVRASLIGLRRVAVQAGRITFENLGRERLDGANAPAEVQPLIAAVNTALDGIQAGASAQRDFSIHAAHELRTPLADLRLRLEGLPAGADRTAAMRDVDAMARLFEQLLHIARLDGGAAFDLQPLDLAETVAEVLREAAPRLMAEGRPLEAEGLDSSVPVLGDPTLIALVLRNLLDNVRKHSPVGTQVTVRVAGDGTVFFHDTGPGPPPRIQRAGFARFARGGEDVRSGSGLGLSICETAMRRMGGTFHLEPSAADCLFVMTFQTVPRPHAVPERLESGSSS
ncbi:MAG: HAMP domain-containing sensor histidine kinase [Pseudomonadota bacterium]|nr:HAMP domain-containing sensor histidine kinase [Pseudomonadota bacterium]